MIRHILFGYLFNNAQIAIHPKECSTVQEIYSRYCCGQSLKTIAQYLTDNRIEYLPNHYTWDKARVRRILMDERYYKGDEYPAIITKAQYDESRKLLQKSNSNKLPIDELIKLFKSYTVCDTCGSAMSRRVNSRLTLPVSWKCPHCGLSVKISDEVLKETVFSLQSLIAFNPSIAKLNDGTTALYSIEAKRLTNEIHRQLDSGNFSEDELIKMVLRCAAENYNAIIGVQHITDRLTAVFANAGPLSSFNQELFTQTVKYIRLASSGEILLQLLNGKIIGEDDVK